MAQKENKALIPRPSSELTTPSHRRSPVIARMTQDLLARAEPGDVRIARFRIGEYLLREPDYRQIMDWAEELGMEPRALLQHLSSSQTAYEDGQEYDPIGFQVIGGSIQSLAWDLDTLGIIPSRWRSGLMIKALALIIDKSPTSTTTFAPRLENLKRLVCENNRLVLLELSQVPGLLELHCRSNQPALLR